MKPENSIEVHNISKSFRVYYDKGHTLKEMTLFSRRRKFEERKVLNDISFNVKRGEAIGLIGHNGCGKSTTLKLLTRIMYPDMGTIEMDGRVSSLIELGAGFHPDMSGRQNIYTNASIFGLTRREIEARIDDIIDFSELGQYIDNPVRTYSSGMYMRLAFAVAINVDAEILLIDEILAVGDANFQAKCFDKLKEIKTNGTTIVIVSHSLSQIEQICERSIWIHNGKIEAEGTPRDIHPLYLEYMGQKRQDAKAKDQDGRGKEKQTLDIDQKEIRKDSGIIEINNISILNGEGIENNAIRTGEDIKVKLDYNLKEKVEGMFVGFSIYSADDIRCYETNTQIDKIEPLTLEGKRELVLSLKNVPLIAGKYSIDLKFEVESGLLLGFYKKILEFNMYSDISDSGICRIEHNWSLQ